MIYNFALLGNPVEQSLSPQIHAEFLRMAGLKGGYICLHTEDHQLKSNINCLQKLGFKGANLTIPHKMAGLKLADYVSPEASLIGACNTLIFDGQLIKAENTDWKGFLESLPSSVRHKCQKAVVLGSGGSARAVVMALCKMQVKQIVLLVRDSESSRKNAQNITSSFSSMAEIVTLSLRSPEEALRDGQLIINTTPLGMYGKETSPSPLTKQHLKHIHSQCHIYDLIYNPAETELIKLAKDEGYSVQNGYRMLYFQAAFAFSLWTGTNLNRLINTETCD